MTFPQWKRLFMFMGLFAVSTFGLYLVLKVFDQNLIYFQTPADILNNPEALSKQKIIRLGGFVEKGSIHRNAKENGRVTFTVEHEEEKIPVTFMGVLPDLFREGQGIVVEGRLLKDGAGEWYLEAQQVLAKHDESYKPPVGKTPPPIEEKSPVNELVEGPKGPFE